MRPMRDNEGCDRQLTPIYGEHSDSVWELE